MKVQNLILVAILAASNSMAQPVTKSRLTATRLEKNIAPNIWAKVDSTTYTYLSGFGTQNARHAQLTTMQWQADTIGFGQFDAGTQLYGATMRQILTYDGLHQLTERLLQEYSSGNWVNKGRYTYSYTGTDLTTQVFENYISGNWQNTSRNTYTYDNNHNMAITQNEFWDAGTQQWELSTRTSHTYNTANDPVEIIAEQYQAPLWKYTNKDMYIYNPNGSLSTLTYHSWDGTSWVPTTQYTMSYNTNNLREEAAYDNYNTSTQAWDKGGKTTYAYDVDSNITEESIYQWDGAAYQPKTSTSRTFNNYHQRLTAQAKNWDAGTQQFAPYPGSTYYHYYYQQYQDISSVPAAIQNTISLFPNPATNQLRLFTGRAGIYTSTVEVFDITGKLLLRLNLGTAPEHSIDVSTLAAGTYILHLHSGGADMIEDFTIIR
jgi:hypothetical protein